MTNLVQESVAISLLEEAKKAKIVAIDTETDYVKGEHRDCRDGTGKALGVSIAYRSTNGITSFFMPFRYLDVNYDRGIFIPVLQEILSTKPCVFHNAKFDLVSLRTLGLNTDSTKFYDTMLMAHLINENSPIAGKGLDSVSKYYLKNEGKHFTKELKTITEKVGWGYVPAQMLAEYATMDTVLTLQLFEFFEPRMSKENLWKVWEHREKFSRALMNMECRGVAIDVKMANTQNEIGTKRMAEIVQALGGYKPSSPKDLYKLLCQDLGLPEIINPKTGRKTFDKKAMEEYEIILDRINNPIAKLVLEYRGWSKAVTSYYRPYVDRLSPDGRLRPSYKLHGTVTGRLSCAEPNLQQIPRESDKVWNGHLKKVFKAKEGYSLVEIDYSQLELRLGTAYAQEPELIEVFNEGRDIFSEMAEKLGQSRQDTKTMVYSIQYGAGVNRIKNVFGVTAEEARNRIDNYYKAYPNFKKQTKLVESMVYAKGKVPLWSGRFRHFDCPQTQGYKAFNSVIQGGAADIVERMIVKLENMNIPGTRLLLTVHDSIVFEIENSVKGKVVPKLINIMEDVDSVMNYKTGVRFAVEAKEWR